MGDSSNPRWVIRPTLQIRYPPVQLRNTSCAAHYAEVSWTTLDVGRLGNVLWADCRDIFQASESSLKQSEEKPFKEASCLVSRYSRRLERRYCIRIVPPNPRGDENTEKYYFTRHPEIWILIHHDIQHVQRDEAESVSGAETEEKDGEPKQQSCQQTSSG